MRQTETQFSSTNAIHTGRLPPLQQRVLCTETSFHFMFQNQRSIFSLEFFALRARFHSSSGVLAAAYKSYIGYHYPLSSSLAAGWEPHRALSLAIESENSTYFIFEVAINTKYRSAQRGAVNFCFRSSNFFVFRFRFSLLAVLTEASCRGLFLASKAPRYNILEVGS